MEKRNWFAVLLIVLTIENAHSILMNGKWYIILCLDISHIAHSMMINGRQFRYSFP